MASQRKPFEKMSVAELERALTGTKNLLADRRVTDVLPDDGLKLRKNIGTIESLLVKRKASSSSNVQSSLFPLSTPKETRSFGNSVRQTAAYWRTVQDEESRQSWSHNDLSVDGITQALASLRPDLSESLETDGSVEDKVASQPAVMSTNLPLKTSDDINSSGLHGPQNDPGSIRNSVPNTSQRASTDQRVFSPASTATIRRGNMNTPTSASKAKQITVIPMADVMILLERDRKAQQELLARVQAANPHLRQDTATEQLIESRAVQFLQYRDEEDKISDEEVYESGSEDVITEEEDE